MVAYYFSKHAIGGILRDRGEGYGANGAAVRGIHQVSVLEMTIQSKNLLELKDNYEGHGNQGVDPEHAFNLMSSPQASSNLCKPVHEVLILEMKENRIPFLHK